MTQQPTLFVFVTAAGAAKIIPHLLARCVQARWITYTVVSPNVEQVLPVTTIYDLPGCQAIRAYGQPPLDRFPFGTMLVAPCTFNTLNKLAHGFADGLVTSMVADALGRGCPIFIAPAMNVGLWRHPQTHASLERLRHWGCQIIGPRPNPNTGEMAPLSEIFVRLEHHFSADKDVIQDSDAAPG